jgi:uncharacterized protein
VTGSRLPKALLEFTRLFNRGDYWESHEALEGAWRETGSAFYQGLILYASAFVHLRRGNRHGVLAQLRKAEVRLAPLPSPYLGVDVGALLASARALRERVEREGSSRGRGAAADWMDGPPPPRLEPDPALVRGDEPEL